MPCKDPKKRSLYQKKWERKNATKIKKWRHDYNRKPVVKSRNRRKTQRWRKENPVSMMLHSARQRAKKKGIDFSIDAVDVVIPFICPLLGIPLFKIEGQITPNSPSIDRIDPNKGYVKGNVWVISHRANTIKSDANLKELEMIVRELRKVIKKSFRSTALIKKKKNECARKAPKKGKKK